ncbi:uncharacterized protein QC761_0024580 [Podospora bellae-mahoneyi]|uniref:Uncharacterized protein n=1 Tax=Podospora bellae-mahoneyi TaxID=2093777 RepID=A0ABR0FSN8_9PEZI|nr:hypothetical protein QC761_0024580 [Podospora bellae-mahoneyi]
MPLKVRWSDAVIRLPHSHYQLHVFRQSHGPPAQIRRHRRVGEHGAHTPAISSSCLPQQHVKANLHLQRTRWLRFHPSDTRDKFGDTISIGSSTAITNWKKAICRWQNKQTYYTGTLYGLPDRGWNTQGTQNTILAFTHLT